MKDGGPIEAVFLSLDSAKGTSGASILAPDYGGPEETDIHEFQGGYVLDEYGKVNSQPERERFVTAFIDLALELDLPPVTIGETWDPPRIRKTRLAGGGFGVVLDPKWNPKTLIAMGEGWGRWAAELESASNFLQEDRGLPGIIIERVAPNEWLGDLVPRHPKDSAARKAVAQRYFEGVFGYRAGPDISDAGCMALWGSRSPRVATAVEAWWNTRKPRRKKAS